MNEDVMRVRARWGVALAGAVAIMSVFVFLVRVPGPPVSLTTSFLDAPRAVVKMASRDDTDVLLKEEAELRDPLPLFLPTARNAALPDPRLEPGVTFLDSENLKPALADLDVKVGEDLPPIATLHGVALETARPRDALAPEGPGMSLLGFGRSPAAIVALVPRGGFVEVTQTRNGMIVIAQELAAEARPPGGKPWSPVEFFAVVDRAGLASPLVVTESSRVEEVDVYIRNFLTRELRIGERLEPGFYWIVVAP